MLAIVRQQEFRFDMSDIVRAKEHNDGISHLHACEYHITSVWSCLASARGSLIPSDHSEVKRLQ